MVTPVGPLFNRNGVLSPAQHSHFFFYCAGSSLKSQTLFLSCLGFLPSGISYRSQHKHHHIIKLFSNNYSKEGQMIISNGGSKEELTAILYMLRHHFHPWNQNTRRSFSGNRPPAGNIKTAKNELCKHILRVQSAQLVSN